LIGSSYMTPQQIITKVKEIVPEVYLVGGACRDMLLGRHPVDYDFTTSLRPDNVEALVRAAGRRPYDTGKRFGTIGFKVMDGTTPYYVEVTTYRAEQYEPGNRKPQVQFVTDLRDDLSRRDFTINAIAYDGEQFIDPFGGRLDILARKIKAVGNAKDRFREDPLRMLRAARFSAQLGFDIDPNMVGFMRRMARTIYTVSRERWVQELDKLLASPQAGRGLRALHDSYLLRYMLPEVNLLAKVDPREWDDTISGIEQLSGIPGFASKEFWSKDDIDRLWASLLCSIGLPFVSDEQIDKGGKATAKDITRELSVGIAARLKFSNDRTSTILNY
jgi:poly(A) polymerase